MLTDEMPHYTAFCQGVDCFRSTHFAVTNIQMFKITQLAYLMHFIFMLDRIIVLSYLMQSLFLKRKDHV